MTKRLLCLALIASLSGCAAVGPKYAPPTTQTAPSFATAIGSAQEPASEFWKAFNDAILNQLIDDALKANHDVRIAVANLREARANRESIDAAALPGIGASASAQRSVNPQTQAPGSRSERTGNSLSAGVDANWEVNFFGRVDRARDEAAAFVEAAEAGIYAAQVIVSGEVARNYFELRGLQNQLALLQSTIRNQEETVKIVEARLEAGRGTELDTSRASALLANARASVPALEAAIGRAAYRIAVLSGKQPQAMQTLIANAQPLPALAPVTAIGTPESLLRRRPDIRVAERQIAAAIARVGLTHTDMFPKVNISGLLGLNAATVSGLVEGAAFRYSLGASIVYNLFDFGLVKKRIEAADARAEVALVTYEKTVLLALEETESALLQYTRSATQTEALVIAARNSEQATKLARARFDAGVSDFLVVLDAERQLIADQNNLAQAQTASATSLIAVYKALGGGWISRAQ
jgi:outer membrane protein, multidrug efflux system